MASDFLHGLNPPQRQAATHTQGPLLILAGAGSGKTRVITHRAAYLIDQGLAHPEQILAVTFTNKAAAEMRERVDRLLVEIGRPQASGQVTISTFHALGARLLRRHANLLGLGWSFQIYDDADQQRLIRELLTTQDKPADVASVRAMRGYIERMKNRGHTPSKAHEHAFRGEDEEAAFFYESYQEALRQANCVDFGDLILGVLQIFRAHPALATSYSKQWRYIMVDEFQDTNPAQSELLTHLTLAHDNLVVVGDDDQAIYRWRGATIANILGFEKDYKDAKVVKLEQNYRSTQVILDAADQVIRQNASRRQKTLWTQSKGGAPLVMFTAQSDREEAQYVADKIRTMVATTKGRCWRDFAIFFRTNAQARSFEEQLRFCGIPYQIVGGTSFYQREEIKDLLAYLKVALNPGNAVDLMRILNTPSRGIGQATQLKLTQAATIPGINTTFHAIRFLLGEDMTFDGELSLIEPDPQSPHQDMALEALERIGASQREGFRDFYETMETLRDDLLHYDSLAEVFRSFIERIHYMSHIATKNPDSAEDKVRNVGELINAIEEFEKHFDPDQFAQSFLEEDMIERSDTMLADARAVRLLRAFLDQSALLQSTDFFDDQETQDDGGGGGQVTLMTVHGSKGLEFEVVFLAGMEEGLFPSVRDAQDAEELEEERRLAYVAITRAKEQLFITNAKKRRVYGDWRSSEPSQFLLSLDAKGVTVDPKSCEDRVDWTSTNAKRRARRDASLSDEEAYFQDAQLADATFTFDQSPAMLKEADRPPEFDEFSQVSYDLEHAAGMDAGFEEDPKPAGGSDDLVGKTVTHSKYGIGRIKAASGKDDRATITVLFPTHGEQKVVRRYLKVLG